MSLKPNKAHHFFICHHQGSGGDQANLLCEALRLRGFKVWYDNDQTADQRNLQGMRKGVQDSECLLLFLSGRKETDGQPDMNGEYEGPFSRWFCHEEMWAAHVHSLKVVGVMESDDRHGKPYFDLEKSRALTGSNTCDGDPVNEHARANVHLLADVCFIPFRRQQHERQSMVDEILRQREVNQLEPLSALPSTTATVTDHGKTAVTGSAHPSLANGQRSSDGIERGGTGTSGADHLDPSTDPTPNDGVSTAAVVAVAAFAIGAALALGQAFRHRTSPATRSDRKKESSAATAANASNPAMKSHL